VCLSVPRWSLVLCSVALDAKQSRQDAVASTCSHLAAPSADAFALLGFGGLAKEGCCFLHSRPTVHRAHASLSRYLGP